MYYFHCGVGDVVRNLCNNGIIPNKSKKTTLPIIPDNMYRHFIRGLFDGDGSLSFSYDGNYRRYTFSIVGNENLMIGVKNVVKSQTSIDLGFGKMKMIHRVYKRGNRQIIKILKWLYDDSTVSLKRKNKRYQEMLDYYN